MSTVPVEAEVKDGETKVERVSVKKRLLQVVVGSVFAVSAFFAVAYGVVSEQRKADEATPSGQMAVESNQLTVAIATLKNAETNRVRLLQKKAEYASLMADKASHETPVNYGDTLDWSMAAVEYNCQIEHKHVNLVDNNPVCTDEASKYQNPKVTG